MAREVPNIVVVNEECTRWKPPTAKWWKVNTDAAVGEGRIGMDMVVRDHYAFDAGYRKVEFETDCSNLVELLNGRKKERSVTQMVVKDILELVKLFEACTFNFAKRQCNKVAHAMAKASLLFEDVLVWMD
ncbi:uncharacterized protein [Spinacia oleracea]|uniref:RNase H type-1 domain-containing protein n=1 Tax=Spinacia oleracea TaxID=3562 RepID=A0ABM3QUA7_SPIOL|nr:uncharacterized protein LOC130462532 [Spinacia oleracea]